MNKIGFYISKLSLQGDKKPDATIDFAPGCNVVSGASNTGKTYILQCIDFVLGSGSKPKNIPEANSYKHAFLELRTYEGEVFTLMREFADSSKITKINSTIDRFWEIHELGNAKIYN